MKEIFNTIVFIFNTIVFIVGCVFVAVGAWFLRDSELRFIVLVILGVNLVETAMRQNVKEG